MTDAKKYLQMIRLYDTRINAKLSEKDHLKDMVTKVTTSLSDDAGFGGGSQDKLGNIVARIVDLENEINTDVDNFVNSKKEIDKVLDRIGNHDQYEVLHKRYVQYMTWEQIACEMHMTYRNVCYIHGKALQSVKQIMEGKEHEWKNI